MALGALRQGAASRPQAARQGAARQRGDPCDWFRAPARLGQVAPLEVPRGQVAPLEVPRGQVAPREVRLAQVLRHPATQWSWLAHRKKRAIRRETLPHCLLALAADPLLPRALEQRRCRAILLSGQAGRP